MTTLFNVSLHVSALIVFIHICVINAVISSTGVFVAITNNTLYESKLYIFILFYLKIIRILRSCSMKIFSSFPTVNISKLNY